jgi:hypothetical protein
MSGKFCFSKVVADDRAEFRAMLFGKRTGGVFKLRGPHIVGRRVDQIAGQCHGLGDAREIVAIDTVGQYQPHRLVLALAVAREAVGAERESQCAEACIMWRIGETIRAGR